MKLLLKGLKTVSKDILSLQQNTEVISIKADYYWTISLEDAYATNKPIPTIGSLADDWEWLTKVLKKQNISTTIDFERLGNIITSIGHCALYSPAHKNNGNKWHLNININHVIILCNLLLTKAENAGFEEITINIDDFWDIQLEEAYDISQNPTVVTNNLSQSWKKLDKLLRKVLLPQPQHFETLGRFIKVVGEIINTSEHKANWLIINK